MTDLSDSSFTDSLKREVAVPGAFATAFPATQDTDLVGSLKDAFWTASLDGWFPGVSIDDDGSTTPDLSGGAAQLVVIYAGTAILRTQLQNLGSSKTYKAGPVEFSTAALSGVLTARLTALEKRIADLIARDQAGGGGTPTYCSDGYVVRSFNSWECIGGLDFGGPWEGGGGMTFGDPGFSQVI